MTADQAKTGTVRWLIETALLVLAALLIAQFIKAFIVQPYVVPSGSMLPTIQLKDRVIAEKLTYRFRDPQAGEIVVFDNPDQSNPAERIFIKRVIAVGGQTVDLRDGTVYIDGRETSEPYVHGQPTEPFPGSRVTFPLTVPQGQVLLLGDNRQESGDGRIFGPQPISAVHGRAFVTYWPLGHLGWLRTETPQPS